MLSMFLFQLSPSGPRPGVCSVVWGLGSWPKIDLPSIGEDSAEYTVICTVG